MITELTYLAISTLFLVFAYCIGRRDGREAVTPSNVLTQRLMEERA